MIKIIKDFKAKTKAEANALKMKEQKLELINNAIARERIGFEETYPKMIKRICYDIATECSSHIGIFCAKKQANLHQILSEFN